MESDIRVRVLCMNCARLLLIDRIGVSGAWGELMTIYVQACDPCFGEKDLAENLSRGEN